MVAVLSQSLTPRYCDGVQMRLSTWPLHGGSQLEAALIARKRSRRQL